MPDYMHMMNVIQREVLVIRERHALERQTKALDELTDFLVNQINEIDEAKQAVRQALRDALAYAEEESRSDVNPDSEP